MNPDQTINLNQNAAQCIHSASYWGKDIYFNICAHTQTEVMWGGLDWCWNLLGYGAIFGFVLFMLLLGLAFLYSIITE